MLGGTFETGVETLEPDPGETERILADHAALLGAMEGKGWGRNGEVSRVASKGYWGRWRGVAGE